MNVKRITHLVCALATAPLVVEGAGFTRTCAKCGARLAVAPTGEALLKEQPQIRPICLPCFHKLPAVEIATRPPTREQIAEALGPLRPNTWRERN